MELFLLVVAWLLFGCIAAVIAENKGNNQVAWYLAGAILGPFGVILALVWSTNEAKLERNAIEGRRMKRCQQCLELIRAKAVRCRHCGADVEVEIVEDESPVSRR